MRTHREIVADRHARKVADRAWAYVFYDSNTGIGMGDDAFWTYDEFYDATYAHYMEELRNA